MAFSLRSPVHVGAFYHTGEAWTAMLSFLHEASWSGDRTLLICDETRRTALIQRLDNKGFGAGNSDLRIRLTMRSWQELYQSDQMPGPTALPGLIDAALIESRAFSVPVASVWSDILLPAVQAADTQVMADYARRLSDLVMQHNCNLVCSYESTGWDAPALLKVVSVHPMVLAGSHIQSNPFFEHPARWLSRAESAAELPSSNRDLAALSMLSTTWCNRDPPGIAGDLATALASIVNAEFIATTSLGDGREGYRLAWTRSAAWAASDVIDAVRAAAPGHLEDSFAGVMAEIANPADLRTCRVLFVPMGLGANALLVIGSVDPRFPTASQRTLIGLSVSLLSISIQRWRAETEEHRFTILVGNSKDFIGIASLDGTPQYVNSAGLQLVGLNDVEQCRQLTILDFLPESDRIRVRDECWRIVTETGRWCGELRLRNFKTGAIIPVLVDWFRIDDKRTGKAAVMATVSRDLTAQKEAEAELRSLNNRLEQQIRTRTIALSDANVDLQRAEELRRHADARLQELQAELFHAGRLSAMGQMAGALAHELGQPLGAIANYINAARRFLTEGRDHEPELARTNMDHAAEVVLRAGRIIERLREFVAGGQPERHPENIADLIDDAGLLALIGAAALDIAVTRHIAPNLPLALVDRTQIQQVLVNLIRNAIEAMVDGERRELILTAAQSDTDTIGITVADSGPGISDEVASRLFQPFVTTKRQSMGLGLSICRSIVEEHGGQLWNEPGASGGTVFRFTVPTVDRDDDVQ